MGVSGLFLVAVPLPLGRPGSACRHGRGSTPFLLWEGGGRRRARDDLVVGEGPATAEQKTRRVIIVHIMLSLGYIVHYYG